MAMDLGSGRVIQQLNGARRLTPASVSKLYVAAAALEKWGPDHRFTTRLLSNGKIRDGILHGDLIFLGAGDPSLEDRDLWSLVMQLRARGVRQVAGLLEINQSLFGTVECGTEDRCEAQTATRHAYDAPLSAAGINFATWCVEVRPAEQNGASASMGWCRVPAPSVTLGGQVITSAEASNARISVGRQTKGGRDRLDVSGRIPLGGEPVQVYRAVSDAAGQTAEILQELLRDAGITVAGSSSVSDRPPGPGASTLAAVEGQSLREQLARMMAYSNNYMADMLALDLIAYGEPASAVSLNAAGEGLQRFAEAAGRRMSHQIEVGDGAPRLGSGSGLTVESALSAADITALLADLYHRTDLFPTFLGALSVPRYSPLRSLRNGDGVWLSRLSVKTGSLNDPRSVMALAGYFRTDRGGWGAFAIIVNGSERRPHIPRAEALAAMREDVSLLLQPR